MFWNIQSMCDADTGFAPISFLRHLPLFRRRPSIRHNEKAPADGYGLPNSRHVAQAQLIADISNVCPDEILRSRLEKVLVFLSGYPQRLGSNSILNLLPELPLQMIAKKVLAQAVAADEEKHLSH
jgi:hypothetical protein